MIVESKTFESQECEGIFSPAAPDNIEASYIPCKDREDTIRVNGQFSRIITRKLCVIVQ